jgi:hypothetical protein
MTMWQKVWRDGFAPALSRSGLLALRRALEQDDLRITQGSTIVPPPLACAVEWPVEATCALGFCAWQGDGCETVGEIDDFFAKCCHEADERLGEPAACRWFLNWYDDTPRPQMIRELLEEVERELEKRKSQAPTRRTKRLLSKSKRRPAGELACAF